MERSLDVFWGTTKERFHQTGVRLGDNFLIKPIWGNQSILALKHTEIYFSSKELAAGNKKVVILPSFPEDHFRVVLKISQTSSTKEQSEERFYLRSLSENPFWINGQWCFECYLERGDKVKIGNNILDFTKNQATQNFRKDLIEPLKINSQIIKSDINLLIEGETGTGKSYLAKKIHEQSGVRGKFVHINLSAFSSELLESELFGHKKGAFTGAVAAKRGAFEEAQHGTLFLDEIDSLSLDIQTKLLLFLDSGKYRAVGDTKESKIVTRLILATGQNLEAMIEKNIFRKDFFFRISSGFHYKLSPLREKPEMIKKFCEFFSIHNNVQCPISLITFYQTLPWPGNIRQLKGHLEKKKTICKNKKLFFDDFDQALVRQSSNLSELAENFKTMEEIKLAYAKKVYFECDNNLTLSSKKLDLSRRTLKRMLDKVA